jgi:hypothetical protein
VKPSGWARAVPGRDRRDIDREIAHDPLDRGAAPTIVVGQAAATLHRQGAGGHQP